MCKGGVEILRLNNVTTYISCKDFFEQVYFILGNFEEKIIILHNNQLSTDSV